MNSGHYKHPILRYQVQPRIGCFRDKFWFLGKIFLIELKIFVLQGADGQEQAPAQVGFGSYYASI